MDNMISEESNIWEISTNKTLLLNSREASNREIILALKQNDGYEIRTSLPEMRFNIRKLLPSVVEFFGDFPNNLKLRTGVIHKNHFLSYPSIYEHVIVDHNWYPIDHYSRETVNEILGLIDNQEKTIKTSDYFSLIANPKFKSVVHKSENLNETKWRDEIIPQPINLIANLYEFQKVGVSQLKRLAEGNTGALLGDEMGLGKTLQIIALMSYLSEEQELNQNSNQQIIHDHIEQERDFFIQGLKLVVAPSFLLKNWEREIQIFSPTLKTLIHAGPHRTGIAAGFENFDIILTSYETLLNDITLFEDISLGLVVLDEAQYIRNPETQRSIAVKKLNRNISIAVTGTPVENTLKDLWSISEFIFPDLLGKRENFEEIFPDQKVAAEELGTIVSPIVIRRLVKDVLDSLPEKIEITVPLNLAGEDFKHYSKLENTLETFQERRVICAHASEELLGGDFKENEKVEWVCAILREIFEKNEKAIIFSNFRRSINRLENEVSSLMPGVRTGIIQGDVPSEGRLAIVDTFAEYDGPGCLMLNPKAAGVGLNITSANHVIHFDPAFNPAVTAQATARSYRNGQERPVFVYHLFYCLTVEEDAVEAQDFKRSLAQGVDQGLKTKEN